MAKIVGRWSDKAYTPEHAEWRLNTTPFLWAESSEGAKSEPQKRKSKKVEETSIRAKLQPLAVPNMTALYSETVRECRSGTLPPTFTARDLREIIPHAVSPDRGYPLGTLLEDSKSPGNADNPSNPSPTEKAYDAANPSTRREGRLPGRGGAKIVAKGQPRAMANDSP